MRESGQGPCVEIGRRKGIRKNIRFHYYIILSRDLNIQLMQQIHFSEIKYMLCNYYGVNVILQSSGKKLTNKTSDYLQINFYFSLNVNFEPFIGTHLLDKFEKLSISCMQ